MPLAPCWNKKIKTIVLHSATPLLKKAVLLLRNPVKDHIQLSVASPVKEDATVLVIGPSGSVLKTVRTKLAKGSSLVSIECPLGWKSGTYFIKTILGNEVFTKKMVLIR